MGEFNQGWTVGSSLVAAETIQTLSIRKRSCFADQNNNQPSQYGHVRLACKP